MAKKKTTKTTKKTKASPKMTAGVIAGVLAAGAAGYLLFGPQGKKNRKKMQDWMMDAKADIVTQAKKIKASTKEEFGDVIDAVMEGYTDVKKITKKEAKELKKDLMGNWDQLAVMLIKGDYQAAEKTVVTKVKKHASAAAGKAKKKVAKKVTPTKKKSAKKTTKKPAAKKKATKKTTKAKKK